MTYHFRHHLQVRPSVQRRATHSRTGLEYVADLSVVCASAAYTWAEVAACVCAPGTVSQKWPKLPLNSHNRRKILCLQLQNRNETTVLSVKGTVPYTSEESDTSQVIYQEHLFSCEGIANEEFVPPGQTVNQRNYWKVLLCLTDQVCWKQLEQWWTYY
jgi:hypothetical protein